MKLRMLEPKDAVGMLEWMHDSKVNRFFRFDASNMTLEKAQDFIEKSRKEAELRESYNFAIADENDEYLGTISLKDIDWQARVAEYAISIRSAAQGNGIATEATQQILKYAFEELELNRIFLNVLEDNERAIHLYEKCGFKYEGLFRNHVNIHGKIKSLKWYSILKEEFEEK